MKTRLTKLKSSPIGLIVWTALVCGSFILLMGGGYKEAYTAAERLIWVIAALVFVFFAHELAHALTASVLCGCKIQIKLMKDPVGIPALASLFPENVGRGKKIAIYLAPLLLLTVVPTLILVFAWRHLFLIYIAMLNCVGAYFDIIDILILLSGGNE